MTITPYAPMPIGVLAERLRDTPTDDARWTHVMEFLEEFRHESADAHVKLLADEPTSVGDDRWDVFLGALGEHLAFAEGHAIPPWTMTPSHRWCGRAWFVSELPTARVWALAHSPAAFRARGIFLHPDDLIPV